MDCPICNEERATMLNCYCDHSFCKSCFLEWRKTCLKINGCDFTCPICRQVIEEYEMYDYVNGFIQLLYLYDVI